MADMTRCAICKKNIDFKTCEAYKMGIPTSIFVEDEKCPQYEHIEDTIEDDTLPIARGR